MRNASGRPLVDSFLRILIFLESEYFAPPFAHALPTAAYIPVANPLYSELSFGTKTKTRAFSISEIEVSRN